MQQGAGKAALSRDNMFEVGGQGVQRMVSDRLAGVSDAFSRKWTWPCVKARTSMELLGLGGGLVNILFCP